MLDMLGVDIKPGDYFIYTITGSGRSKIRFGKAKELIDGGNTLVARTAWWDEYYKAPRVRVDGRDTKLIAAYHILIIDIPEIIKQRLDKD